MTKVKTTKQMTRGEKVIAFIENVCRVPEGALVGQPLKLLDFQKRFILDVYDNPLGTKKAILSIGRKNGKTALIACLLLVHLAGTEAKLNSQIVSGALTREQASLVFRLAVKMINLNPRLQELIDIKTSAKTLIGLTRNVEYKALAADGGSAQGLSPVLSIIDEAGQVRGSRSDFIDAIETAQGAHENPLEIIISTQAAKDDDWLSIQIDDALNGNDKRTICHLYTAPIECDLLDRKAWLSANPALGVFRSLQDMSDLAEKAKRMPSFENTCRNLNLNQRVATESPFVSKTVWDENSAEPTHPSELTKFQLYGGLDLSSKLDLTAFILIAIDSNGYHNVYSYFWMPKATIYDRAKEDRVPYDVWAKQGFIETTPGHTVDYEFVAAKIIEILTEFGAEPQAIAFDRWRIDLFKKDAERVGLNLPLVPYGQGFKDMAVAVDLLENALINRKLRHGDNPVLKMCAANSRVDKDPAGNRKFNKFKATGRIDGMVALAMAEGASQGKEVEQEKKYQMFII